MLCVLRRSKVESIQAAREDVFVLSFHGQDNQIRISIQIQLFFTSKICIAVMKTAAPSSECSFPFSNIKYVDCSCSELYTNLTSTLMMKQSITQSSTVVESTRVKKCCVLSEASIFDFKI